MDSPRGDPLASGLKAAVGRKLKTTVRRAENHD